MRILSRLFGTRHPTAAPKPADHAVIVNFNYGATDFDPVFELGSQLDHAIATAAAGEFDGNELATDGSDGSLYMYGPDADRLFAVVRPVLEAAAFMQGARVRLRYGDAGSGAREHVVVLGH